LRFPLQLMWYFYWFPLYTLGFQVLFRSLHRFWVLQEWLMIRIQWKSIR
jgi:hypothetical protein